MELILWRHAEAEPGVPDASRVLTPKGRKQAAKMSAWLDRNLPSGCRIWCSPASRTVQTAEALGRKFKVHADLGFGSSPERILELVNWPHAREPALVVGHQPLLGQLAALLVSGSPADWRIRKACAWWLARRETEDGSEVYIKAVMSPDLCNK
jgi:phosphohistidine phosphatase